MKKQLSLLLLLASSTIFSQQLSIDDFRSLIPFLQKQDYKGAFEKSETLLNTTTADTTDARAQVSYINIYASAGMVTLDQMSYDAFEKSIKKFVGKKLKMPGHPCVSDSVKVVYNSFQFLTEKGKTQGYTMTANKDKTNILLFEYFDFKEGFVPENMVGKNVRATGILQSYEVNPNKSKIWIGRLHLAPSYVNRFVPN